jgi:hypothetical protein
MRIAVTGTHGSGKTTLIDDFMAAFPAYERVQEPYWELAQQGTPFADGVTTADLEEQLGQSCGLILASAATENVIFDRCPLDFVAYLGVVSRQEGFEWEPDGKLLLRIEKALLAVDLLVFLPLTWPDEIAVPIELPKLRARVDEQLKRMIRDNLGEVVPEDLRRVELRGPPADRLRQLARLVERP